MRGMPIGQFIPGNSYLHRLDARVKLLGLIAAVAAIVCASSITAYALLFAACLLISILTHLGLRLIIVPLRRMWLFCIIIFSMNALFFDGSTALWSGWIFHISLEGIRQGLRVVVNVGLIMLLSNVMMLTTAPMQITSAFEWLIHPMKLLGLPTDDIALIISAAFQFIPAMIEEAESIRQAQTARGARFESKKLTERVISLLPLVIPIFISAFRRADELALAMEARGYRSPAECSKQITNTVRRSNDVKNIIH